jgi:hypothetical protein
VRRILVLTWSHNINAHHDRSFGLILALLSKHWNTLPDGKRSFPTSLLLVPHRDLAYQFMYWIERIATTYGGPHHSVPAQVVVRGQEEPSSHVARVREKSPSILIGTPQAILDMLHEDKNSLNFSRLSTVVVDEVDYIIGFIPADASGDKKKKLAAKIKRHPSAGKLLLDRIFAPRVHGGSVVAGGSPQLVVCSATLQTGLRQQLYRTGWFKKGVYSVLKIRSEIPARETRKCEQDVAAPDSVQHCALVFSDDGSVRDVEDAVDPKWSSEEDADRQEAQTWTTFQSGDLPEIPTQLAEGELAVPTIACYGTNNSFRSQEYAVTPSTFHPMLMEGIASIFATDVPRVALLILPASAPVQRAVYDLRTLGINAFGLDLLSTERGQAHLVGGSSGTIEDNPTLLVSTTASTRGIDLPDLSHVFIWGVVDANSYRHVSGRVGRFGRGGSVLSVLEKRRADGDEPGRYLRLLKSIGMAPSKYYSN